MAAKTSATPPLVVLDTNLLLSALVFTGGRLAPLRTAWQNGRLVPLVSAATAPELIRVLGYPKFNLSAEDRDELLADYLPQCRSVRMPARMPKLPQCRNVSDQIFIELAAVGKADFLLMGDKDLLAMAMAMAAAFGGRVVTAEVFVESLGSGQSR